jgi:phosphopantetheinyl transferase (holo-ACP synthase)
MLEPGTSAARCTSPPWASERRSLNSEVVGNDVVDLADPHISEHHRRERFVSRVCAREEREWVDTALDLWSLFAAKEAAYKALVKLGCSPGFGHREIRVEPGLRAVRWRGQWLELSITHNEQYVHAVAWSGRGGQPPLTKIARAQPAGDAVRALLCDLVAEAIGCRSAELQVVRDPVAGAWDGFGPPRIERRGAPIAADVSLSHDGPFVAVAAIVAAHSKGQ